MRRRYVGEIEGRILAQEDNISVMEIDRLETTEGDMVSDLSSYREAPATGDQSIVPQAHVARQLVIKLMPTSLRL
jgi:hypothetical protein